MTAPREQLVLSLTASCFPSSSTVPHQHRADHGDAPGKGARRDSAAAGRRRLSTGLTEKKGESRAGCPAERNDENARTRTQLGGSGSIPRIGGLLMHRPSSLETVVPFFPTFVAASMPIWNRALHCPRHEATEKNSLSRRKKRDWNIFSPMGSTAGRPPTRIRLVTVSFPQRTACDSAHSLSSGVSCNFRFMSCSILFLEEHHAQYEDDRVEQPSSYWAFFSFRIFLLRVAHFAPTSLVGSSDI